MISVTSSNGNVSAPSKEQRTEINSCLITKAAVKHSAHQPTGNASNRMRKRPSNLTLRDAVSNRRQAPQVINSDLTQVRENFRESSIGEQKK